jgi:radical SAM superfamily enzyme YgiQ (UPF0313 family)
MEQIVKDLEEARQRYKSVKRVFLVNADPFVLSAERLSAIALKINELFPEIVTITTYASIRNIQTKTDQELKKLRELKINELNIGLESGMEDVLAHLNKGFTLKEAKRQLNRLRNANIEFSANIIIGAAGAERSLENSIVNSELLNEINPYLIYVATLHTDPGSKLYDEIQAGNFIENTLGQNLLEEIEMLKRLDLNHTAFYGLHPSNVIPIAGMLPGDQKMLIQKLERGMKSISLNALSSRPKKGAEGRIKLRI